MYRCRRDVAQETARLTMRLRCDRDAFFDHFPPLLGLTVIGALRARASATLTQTQSHSIVKHLVALLGGNPPRQLLADYLLAASGSSVAPQRGKTAPSRATRQRNEFGRYLEEAAVPAPLAGLGIPPLRGAAVRDETCEGHGRRRGGRD